MVSQADRCDLCGLEITGKPVTASFDGEEKHFCCQGCARVYQVAYENDMLDQVVAAKQPQPAGLKDLVFQKGETAHFSLKGMWCAGCASAAENVLRRQPGVSAVDISFAAERGRLVYDPALVEPGEVFKSLDRLGYQARDLTDPSAAESEKKQTGTFLQLVTAVAFGMQVMLLYIVQLYHLYAQGKFNDPRVRDLQYLVWILATPVLLVGGYSILKGAWRALMARTATMDTLVALGTLSAYGYSVYVTLTGTGEAYFDSVAMIITFIMLGRYLELLGGDQARKDIRKLLNLQPEQAWRQQEDEWVQVSARKLVPDEVILVKAGETVPVDAQVISGRAAMNEAMLTGESSPVNRGPGDLIYAGTLATDAPLVARVVRLPAETRLAQITRLVDQTLSIKPPIQRLADTASTYFALGIALTALLTAVGWMFYTRSVEQAVLAAVAVLVVACPCALGLATPLALTVTLGRTTEAGILVRNPVSLETAAQTQRMILDKTGTLTRGKLTVVQTCTEEDGSLSEAELLALAAAVEQVSEHPIARAIRAAAPASRPSVRDAQVLRGLGISAQLEGDPPRRVMVGSDRFIHLNGNTRLAQPAQSQAEQGNTVIWVGWGDVVAGCIVLRDEPNPTAVEAVRQLHAQGIRVDMLSGDNPLTSRAIAQELGLDSFEGRLSPAEKAERIHARQAEGEQVAMAGDGVNDAPALAQADLSITVAGGTDIAGETSDIILTHPDLTLIPWFIRLSGRTRRIIRENLMWAFAYNLVAVPLAAFGLIRPVFAALAMATSSLLVVGNSLRSRKLGGEG